MAMDIFGFGGGRGQSNICFSCNSYSCHHIMGAQQQMSGRALQEHYNLMQQMSAQQTRDITNGFVSIPSNSSGAINITSGTSVLTHGIEVTATKKKPNLKLLLLKR